MTDRKRRVIIMLICLVMGIVALVAYFFSAYEDSIDSNVAKEYILAHHHEQTGAFNAVTSIYLNYRLWDTLFEAMVLMLSALAVITFSWRQKDE